MRRSSALPKPPAGQPLPQTHAWLTVRTLFPYLWRYRLRVLAALACLIGAKVANVGVPMIFKDMIDGLSGEQQLLALPAGLLILYGLLRFSTSLFAGARSPLRPRHPARRPARCRWKSSGICTRCRCAFISNARPAACRVTSSGAAVRYPA